MRIREATSADLDLVVAMRLAFLAEHRGLDVGELEPGLGPRTRDHFERGSRLESLHTWLAFPSRPARAIAGPEEPVGLVSLVLLDLPPRPGEERRLEGYVANMWVETRERGKGLGGALLDACARGAAGLGVSRLLLHSTTDGRSLYEAHGFEPNPTWMERPLRP